jgi:hypothetical protein
MLSGAGELDLDVAAGQPVADASVKEAATRGRRACGAVYERPPAQGPGSGGRVTVAYASRRDAPSRTCLR